MALAVLLIIGAGWIFGISPQLSDAAATNAVRISVVNQNASNGILLAKLKRDYQQIDSLRANLEVLRAAVPTNANFSSFVTELNQLANTLLITVRSITVNDAKPYAPVTAQAPNSTGTSAPPTLTDPRITTSNFVVIPVQFAVTGNYANVLDFVHEVQVGQRLFLVTTLMTTGSTSAKAVANSKAKPSATTPQKVDATIGGYIYVLSKTGK